MNLVESFIYAAARQFIHSPSFNWWDSRAQIAAYDTIVCLGLNYLARF